MNTKGQFNNNRGFGVEIEFLRPMNVSKQDICDALPFDAEEEGYNHQTREHWKLTSDCSVYSNPSREMTGLYNGFYGSNEFVSPILYGEDGFNQLKIVLDKLNELGCKINYTCGIHVHHDVTANMLKGQKHSEKFLANLVKFVAKYEHLIYKLVSPSRLDSRDYSTPVRKDFLGVNSNNYNVTDSRVKDMIRKVKSDCRRKYSRSGAIDEYQTYPTVQRRRACGLNFQNVWTRGSVEFRYHNGSTNFEKIASWVVFTQAIVNAVEDTKSVSMSYVPNNIKGLSSLRGAVGFIRRSGLKPSERTDFVRDEYVSLSNKYLQKRFKEMSKREDDYSSHFNYEYVKDGIKGGAHYQGLI